VRRKVDTPRYTIFVDASYNRNERLTGIGVVMHRTTRAGRNGEIIERIAEGHRRISHDHGEAFAILRALQIARDREFRIVRIRCDDNSLRTMLKEDHKGARVSRGSPYYADILEIARSFEEVKFGFTPRRKNQNAHRLSRQGARHDPQTPNKPWVATGDDTAN
jgi:ribonuclease HI